MTPFWRTEIGKELVGIEVNHNLKSGFVASENYSTIFSKSGIQEAARWQFCNSTQYPLLSALLTNYWAFGPCPWPREIDYVFFYISFANLRKSVTGSEPGDKRKIKGVIPVESLKHLVKSKVGGMMNYFPSFSVTQSSMAGSTLSILIAFKTTIFWNISSF